MVDCPTHSVARGLTLEDLHTLAGAGPHAAVWDLIGDDAKVAQLGADARGRLTRVRTVLETAMCSDLRRGVREWRAHGLRWADRPVPPARRTATMPTHFSN
jgi:hypothetical protein